MGSGLFSKVCPCHRKHATSTESVTQVRLGLNKSTISCLHACMDLIISRVKEGKSEEGMLRVNGLHSAYKGIVRDFHLSPDNARDRIKNSKTHDVCSAFKELLRDIQNDTGTLLTKQNWTLFKNARDLESLRKFVASLPNINRIALEKLTLMCQIICNDSKTRMTPVSCATVLTPNLVLLDPVNPEVMMKRYASVELKKIITLLIENQKLIFTERLELDEKKPLL
mmetsp:Transcript_4115/g.6054  ORF Transcript_4115/g.6054 Transcript_4115/m.6054 type:complete len:225 (+) Transcript_4115:61-735(+)